MPLPEFAVPDARTGPLDKDANIAQDDCSTSENPCPAGRGAARRPARSRVKGAIRVCDLFDRPLVLSFWFTQRRRLPAHPGRVDRVASPLPWPRELPLDRRPRRPGRGAPDRRRARLDDPGRLRPRRRGQRPLPGGRLPDRRLRLPGRDPRLREGRHRGALASRSSPPTSSGCSASLAGGRARAADERRGRPRGGLGRARAARGVPGARPALPVDRARLRARSTSGEGAPRASSRTGSRARRRSTCATSRSPGPTASSTATSGSTPTSSRPRSRRSRWSA